MGWILTRWRIPLAAILSVAFVYGAYALARGVEHPSLAQASAETELLKAIATKDSDADGLPDWEEALYGTDPQNPDSLSLGMKDGEAVAKGLVVPKAISEMKIATSTPGAPSDIDSTLPPAPAAGTITAAFAESFFSLYLAAKQANGGADLTEGDVAAISSRALESLSSVVAAAPDFKSANDLALSGSGEDALVAFARDAEAVLLANTSTATTSEINYLNAAIQGGDTAAYGHLLSLAKAYRGSAAGLAALPVPRDLAAADLTLINAMARISEIAADFARADTDPLATMLALQQYPRAAEELGAAFTSIGRIYAAAGLSLPEGAPGASFVNLIADVTASEQAANLPAGRQGAALKKP